ncbi:MAG: putative endonuclease [Candidatus Paceibacteria bacterium]|jgi:putative endonuclease
MAVGQKRTEKLVSSMAHYAYIIQCADSTLYTGYTINLEKRLADHNGEGATAGVRGAGARYTSGRRPVKLIYHEKFKTRSEAMQRECAIKRLPRTKKIKLINKPSQISFQ